MKLHRIEKSDALYAQQLRDLYLKAFPRSERKIIDNIYQQQEDKMSDVFALVTADDQFVGLAIILLHPDLIIIEYLAISAAFRSRGYGSKALTLIKERYPDQPICLEIDDPSVEADDLADRLRRLAFYEANDFVQLDFRVNFFDNPLQLMGTSEKITFQEYIDVYDKIYGEKIKQDIYILPTNE